MICVSGAGGTVGGEVVRPLETAITPFRQAYFSIGKAEAARARGLDAVIIDYDDPESLRKGFEGCDMLFLLSPNMPNHAELEINAVQAAKGRPRFKRHQSSTRARPDSLRRLRPRDRGDGGLER